MSNSRTDKYSNPSCSMNLYVAACGIGPTTLPSFIQTEAACCGERSQEPDIKPSTGKLHRGSQVLN